MIEHAIKHHYQPTNYSCSQAALTTLLSFFKLKTTPEDILSSVPINKDSKGKDWGTINQQLATWCISKGFQVDIYTADFQIIDLSWANLEKEDLIERLEKAREVRNIPSLGKDYSRIYTQSYIDFLEAGGNLHIKDYVSTKLIDSLLVKSPLLACVCYNVLHGVGRSVNKNILRDSEKDDISGGVSNHSIVIYGKKSGDYLISDPWKEPGLHAIEPERLLAAMTAAQIECDNLFFQLTK